MDHNSLSGKVFWCCNMSAAAKGSNAKSEEAEGDGVTDTNAITSETKVEEAEDQFSRTRLVLGQEAVDVLAQSHVIVFGIGGVGGYVVEALARAGVGALDLVDKDVVEESNINRQIIATHETVGRAKVDVAAERVRSINPACKVTAHRCFYLPETCDQFDLSQFDYTVDAVDTVTAKLQLAQEAQASGARIISSMGTAEKLDPTAFRVADVFETSICPLARIMRKELRKRGVTSLKVVYSEEVPSNQSERGVSPGSVSFVPSVAGLIIAGEVIKDLTADVRL